ncbi:ABC transporter permease [Anaerosporobacter sp.]|uniref:ABC transporter permease n=1 Tax=Anaerosporobacter sp. TaxID=1872529 RepID=UPI00286F02CA|nr:ABC transporter permease [Anaerosporobacter sp.]
MRLKLIFQNLRRNMKDYGIYFLTMMMSIGIFYAFNAVSEAEALQHLGEVSKFMDILQDIIEASSVVIAIMLGFLILYVNRFLLKRRKKELGIYMLLGMKKRKISGIFVGETLVIGIASLAAGTLFGVLIGQILVLFAIQMFGGNVSAFHLTFSSHAFGVTLLCFAIIYVIAAIFNVSTVSKVRLIDLLIADRKNEELKKQKTWINLSVLLIGIVCVILAMLQFKTEDLLPTPKAGVRGILFMVVATICIFYAVATVAMGLLKKNRKLYYKNINSFLIRQIGSKMQSNFISMAMICLLLTATLVAITTGTSIALTMDQMSEDFAPYDFVLLYEDSEETTQEKVDVLERAKHYEDPVDLAPMMASSYQFQGKSADITYKQLFEGQDVQLYIHDEKMGLLDKDVWMIGISDFNALLRLQNKEELELPKDGFYLNCNYKGTMKYIDAFIKEKDSLVVYGTELKLADKKRLDYVYLETAIGDNDRGTLIVPDAVAMRAEGEYYVLQGNWKKGVTGEQGNEALSKLNIDTLKTSPFDWTSAARMKTMQYAAQGLPVFLCMYIGFVFLLICVALISVEQLTEAEDNQKRYLVLKKQGVPETMMKGTIYKQVGVHFGVPLVLAGVYTMAAMPFITKRVSDFLNMEVGTNMIATLLVMLVIYGGYYGVTCLVCGKMLLVKKKK